MVSTLAENHGPPGRAPLKWNSARSGVSVRLPAPIAGERFNTALPHHGCCRSRWVSRRAPARRSRCGSGQAPCRPAALPRRKRPWLFTAAPSRKYPNGDHHISTKHLNEDLIKLLAALGMPHGREHLGYTIHSLRHSFETICVNSRIPQRVVDTWLGHRSDRSMASVYYRLSDQESQGFMHEVRFGMDVAMVSPDKQAEQGGR